MVGRLSVPHAFAEEERALKRLFLSHHHSDTGEIAQLATELELRGVIPWLDRRGGFRLGDHTANEASRAIRMDCFGLLLYASMDAFGSSFIQKVEIREATKMKKRNPGFLLVAIPRSLSFVQLRNLSMKRFGIDLANFHSIAIPDTATALPVLQEVAKLCLSNVLEAARAQLTTEHLSLQISTRDILPDKRDDVLRIDGSGVFHGDVPEANAWGRIADAMGDVKREISVRFGRPVLHIHGTRHLTSAFLVGRVFSPFTMEIAQKDDCWFTEDKLQSAPLKFHVVDGNVSSGALSLEICVPGKKVVASAVDVLCSNGFQPAQRIQCELAGSLPEINGPMAKDIIRRVRRRLEYALGSHRFTTIHLFAAVPQAIMVLLGRELAPFPPVQLYEFSGTAYAPSILVPSGVI